MALRLPAAAATAPSPSAWKALRLETGDRAMGEFHVCPNSVTCVLTRDTSINRRGRRPHLS